jgi:hypothetical protein
MLVLFLVAADLMFHLHQLVISFLLLTLKVIALQDLG